MGRELERLTLAAGSPIGESSSSISGISTREDEGEMWVNENILSSDNSHKVLQPQERAYLTTTSQEASFCLSKTV